MQFTKIQDCIRNKDKQRTALSSSYNKINKGKSFFLCFRPAVVVDGSGGANGNSVLQFIKMEQNKDGLVFPPRMYPALISSPPPPPEKDAVAHRKKKSHHKKFMRLLKAVFFETSLARKIRKKTSAKKLKQSKDSNPSGKVEKDLNPVKGKSFYKNFSKIEGRTISNNVPSANTSTCNLSSCRLSSSSCASSQVSSNSKQLNDAIESRKMMLNIVQQNGRGYYGSNTGLFLLVVTLLVLVLWGKLYAILCTSTWLFFVPNWNSEKREMNRRVEFESEWEDLEEYNKKKKVIMGGILERKGTYYCRN